MSALPIPAHERILIDSAADEALVALGLSRSLVARAVRLGHEASRTCTAHDPPLLGGLMRWGKTVGFLREALLPSGWVADDAKNYSRTLHPEGRAAIVVASGDSATGRPAYEPCTRQPKGPLTFTTVRQNRQLSLFGPEAVTADAVPTWMLLVSADVDGLWSELSFPADMAPGGWINSWQPRIVLGQVDDGGLVAAKPSPPPSTPPIDVPVHPK